MEKNINKTLRESAAVELPEECPENDRAVRFLAKEAGAGHYDSVNLLVMSALLIFMSVVFIAVNGGDINDDDTVNLTGKTFLSGEYTRSIEKKYNEQLPIPQLMKSAEERISLLYGIGNKLSDPIKKKVEAETGSGRNLFEEDAREDNYNVDEAVVTTAKPQTDKDGNTVTTSQNDVEEHGKATTAINRPNDTQTTAGTTAATASTTTNNDPPEVTTTTTVPYDEPEATTTEETTPTTTEETTQATTQETTKETTKETEKPTETSASEEEPPKEPEEPEENE